jgi:rhodanese-related sulfurtransferase
MAENIKKIVGVIIAAVVVVIVIITGLLWLGETETDDEDANKQQQDDQDKYTVKDITNAEALKMIQNNSANPDFVLLDVRTPDEFDAGHIENATLLDFYSATFSEDLDKLDKNKTYLVYCRTGSRSRSATDIMMELEFKDVYNMLGGIVQWQAEGYPLVK